MLAPHKISATNLDIGSLESASAVIAGLLPYLYHAGYIAGKDQPSEAVLVIADCIYELQERLRFQLNLQGKDLADISTKEAIKTFKNLRASNPAPVPISLGEIEVMTEKYVTYNIS